MNHGATGQGSNSAVVRQFNERVILTALRRLSEASKADLARHVNLTQSAAGQIVKVLEQQRLLRATGRRMGLRGQPATLLRLDPEGAYSIGVRSTFWWLDFSGTVLKTRQHECALPLPDEAMRIVRDDIAGLRRSLAPSRRVRLAGVGLAMPYNLVSWRCELDAPEAICAACAGCDFADRLRATPDLPVFVENDGTAVAIAELFERLGRQLNDFAVVYLDGAIGGGLVLDESYRRGVTGNAGDIGLMPVAPSRLKQTPPPGRPSDILLNRTSVTGLVRHLRANGVTVGSSRDFEAALETQSALVGEWLEDCADALTNPLLSIAALLDLQAIVIYGNLPRPLIERLVARLRALLITYVPEAREPPELKVGHDRAQRRCHQRRDLAAVRALFGSYTLDDRRSREEHRMVHDGEPTPRLEMRGISKTFPGVKALNGVQLKAWGGEVLALMGENGAGKSTLMKILSGAYYADPGGEILIDGQPVAITDPISAKRQGVAIIYQELALAPNLTVAENIYLGEEPSRGGRVDRVAMRAGCQAVLDRLGTPFNADTTVAGLSIAEQQLVEIARALHAQSKILVLDEPTTALSTRETDRLFALVRQLRAEGIALIYISHRMAEVYELADRVAVLRDGGYVGTLTREELNPDTLVKMMVGRDLSTFYTKTHDARDSHGPVVMEVRAITDGGRRVHPCSLQLHRGEVLGIAGLVGSGRTELARLVYGADPKVAGDVLLDDIPVTIRTPEDALEAGIAYLTEDRKALGLFLDLSCGTNINLGVISRDARLGGILDWTMWRRRAAEAFETLRVRAASPQVLVGSLSGGNQQKVLLSRWLEISPKVLILDEPTRGVDIGAKSEIYRIIDDLATREIGIIVISSELPEIIGVCDRVLVMREGRIAGEVGGPSGMPITQENIMSYGAGVAA